MTIAFSHKNSLNPDLVIAGLYPEVLARSLEMAVSPTLDHSDHLYHTSLFISDLLGLGYQPIDVASADINPIIVFWDSPNAKVVKCLLNHFKPLKLILALAEHPAYQPAHLNDLIFLASVVIHSYELPSQPSTRASLRSDTSFVYKNIPQINSIHKDVYKASIFCSNLYMPKPSQYAFRRHLINACNLAFRSEFLHCGRFWQPYNNGEGSLKTLTRIVKHKVQKLRYMYPEVDLSAYAGAPITKAILGTCKTTFAVENYLEPPGYTTEKPLECLSYNCMPIYVAHSENNWLEKFIPIYQPDTIKLISSTIATTSSSSSELSLKAAKIRDSINNYLSTDGSTTLKILYNHIKENMA
jgi:hypothetical protein